MGKATVSVKLAKNFTNIRLIVSKNQSLTDPRYSPVTPSSGNAVKLTVEGLDADTQYYYGLIVDGVLQTQGRGSFKTFPVGAASFKACFASCAYEDSNHIVFERIKNEDPAIFLHMGDLHYLDIMTNDIALFENGYDRCLAQPRQAALYGNVANAYVWDDHDYGMNDGDSTHPAKSAAQAAYRKRYPHYALPTGSTGAIYQAFTIGRVRFIMSDIMSERSPKSATDNSSKVMMSPAQWTWFQSELLRPEPVKVWVVTKPWIGAASSGADYWAGYATERTKVANFIKSNGLQGKVMLLSGDMHGLAIDNGAGADYATGGGADIPVFQAAPLDSSASVKGGGWSEGVVSNASDQYGIMNVTDNGGNTIGIEWLGKYQGNVVISHTFNVLV